MVAAPAPRARGYDGAVTYRDDVDALFARVQALQGELSRLRAEREDERRKADGGERRGKGDGDERRGQVDGPHAASQQKTTAWVGPLIARLPAAEQELIADLVTLLTTRHEYPTLTTVSEEALEKLVVRLRASFKKTT
jgi:hypothetical protein